MFTVAERQRRYRARQAQKPGAARLDMWIDGEVAAQLKSLCQARNVSQREIVQVLIAAAFRAEGLDTQETSISRRIK